MVLIAQNKDWLIGGQRQILELPHMLFTFRSFD